VILVDGALAAHLARGDRELTTFLPDAEPARARAARALAGVLIDRARQGGDSPRGMLIEEIDGLPPSAHPLARYLAEAGFVGGAMGFQPTFGHRPSAGISRRSRDATGLDTVTEP
jgi:ATP-dependent Lhr-like helicase